MTFVIASADGVAMPLIEEMPIDTATYAGAEGALLVIDGAYIEECAADPVAIRGVALTPGGADTSGFNILGRKEFPAGVMQFVRPKAGMRFLAEYTGTLPANLGGSYGTVRSGDGKWRVDFGETTTVSVMLTRKFLSTDLPATAALGGRPVVEVEFLAAVLD